MHLSYSSLCVYFWCPPSFPLSLGSERFPYVSRHGLVDAYCQAGVSRPAWSLAGQDGRWASQPRHTVGGHINPYVSLCVSWGGRVVVTLVFLHTLAVQTLPPFLQHTHIRPPVAPQSVDIHSASKRGGTTKGPGNWKVESGLTGIYRSFKYTLYGLHVKWFYCTFQSESISVICLVFVPWDCGWNLKKWLSL